jgi:hypothetical protein
MALKILKFCFCFTFGFGLLILVNFLTVAYAETNDKDRYEIPSTKVNIPACQQKALLLHPGIIKGMRSLHLKGTSLFEFRITEKNGVDVLVFCNGETGDIIRPEADR